VGTRSNGSGRVWSLEAFTPLLNLPELADVARLSEAGQNAPAAHAMEVAMQKATLLPEDAARWQFLLARLRERANQWEGAAASYDLAAAGPWVLHNYALLGAGRALLRLGRCGEALARLDRIPSDEPVAQPARLLIAEAAFSTRDYQRSIAIWRKSLESRQDAGDRGPGASQSLIDPPSIAVSLSQALLEGANGNEARVIEALSWARRASAQAADRPAIVVQASELERRAIEALPASRRPALARPSPQDELAAVEVLVQARKFPEAQSAAEALLKALPRAERYKSLGCAATLDLGKAFAGQREWGHAADVVSEKASLCRTDADLRGRLLYLAGTYSAADGRHMQAVQLFELLEKELPAHPLADDARLKRALSFQKLGVEARFTELLSSISDDYPNGDVVLDGMFSLAVRRMEKGDWSGAASVLERAAHRVSSSDSSRGTEFSGRERYFLARSWIETGERERGLRELEAIVAELPLSYYMLHASSRLQELAPDRAAQALARALDRSQKQPFSFSRLSEYDSREFLRALELLRQGELELAKRELEARGLMRPGAAPGVLWGVALLYQRAGSAQTSHLIARGLLTDWLERWPVGEWTQAWELAFPRPFEENVRREAARSGIAESLAYAVMREESAFDPEAESPAQAYGLMQLIVPTAKLVAAPNGLQYDAQALQRPALNIRLGCELLARLERRFKTPLLAIPAYNAGPGRPVRWLNERPEADFDVWVELIPLIETRRYTKRVLASRAAYTWLYDREHAESAMRLPIKLKAL
jgi:soluble lytic murein transglycosylase